MPTPGTVLFCESIYFVKLSCGSNHLITSTHTREILVIYTPISHLRCSPFKLDVVQVLTTLIIFKRLGLNIF